MEEKLQKKIDQLTSRLEKKDQTLLRRDDKIAQLESQVEKLKEKNKELSNKNRKLKEDFQIFKKEESSKNKELQAKVQLLESSTKKKVIANGNVVKSKAGKWKKFVEDYPQLADDYYKCVKKYGWVVLNHFHLAGYLRKMVEGDPKEGIPPQMSAERLARRYAFLASIPDSWWNGNILYGPPPNTEAKGQKRINDLNNLIATNPTVKAFWKNFSKQWETESS